MSPCAIAGVDWSSRHHDAVLISTETGQELGYRRVSNTSEGLAELTAWMLRTAKTDTPSAVAIGIEVPHGSIVEHLQDAGFPVWSAPPSVMTHLRTGFRFSIAKDDRRDAFTLAQALLYQLRIDGSASARLPFRRVTVPPAHIVELRTWSRLDDDLKVAITSCRNRLWGLLHRYHSGVLLFPNALKSAWVVVLLEHCPSPAAMNAVSDEWIAAFLANTFRPKKNAPSVEEFRKRIHTAFPLPAGQQTPYEDSIRSLCRQLTVLTSERNRIKKRIDEALHTATALYKDIEILLSVPGLGERTATTIVVESWDCLKNRDRRAFRTFAGIAPITIASGQSRAVVMRRTCNRRVRTALHIAAQIAVIRDPATKAYYKACRERGRKHSAALRMVADRLSAAMFAMLESGQKFRTD